MITDLAPDEIFVFGSNASGQHGAGAARTALERFGAVWGQGSGLQGQSYGIDTMSGFEKIRAEVATFLAFAGEHPELRFLVTKVGCGIAGYVPAEIAPLFAGSPTNVVLPAEFASLLAPPALD
ncbi:hypothetical protein GCM10022239_16350 [Leifsonia bigeumensis]|uniref:Uncharacterized protein n=1 Tax=Leifsonella bigeumensis TaxID=433643 RepID=A0ABP7FQJ1_9MICO